MFKSSKNPHVEELTKSNVKDRSIPLSRVQCPIREDGTKGCVWCGDTLRTKHHAQRYCKGGMCAKYMYAHFYPQKEEGMFFLMARQDWSCNICKHDWKPFIESNIIDKFYGTSLGYFTKTGSYKTEFSYFVIKRLKENVDKKLKPEVDHVVPIFKGGQALGLDNHQCICYSCHKGKTSKDLSKKG